LGALDTDPCLSCGGDGTADVDDAIGARRIVADDDAIGTAGGGGTQADTGGRCEGSVGSGEVAYGGLVRRSDSDGSSSTYTRIADYTSSGSSIERAVPEAGVVGAYRLCERVVSYARDVVDTCR